MKRICCLLMALLLVGCTTVQYKKIISSDVSPIILPKQKVFVSLPLDGFYEERTYVHSGEQVQLAFLDALSRYTSGAETLAINTSLSAAKQEVQKYNADILIYPTIVHWEDRNIPWRRDKIQIQVTVFSLKDGKVLDKASLHATRNWTFFINIKPSTLLHKVIHRYVESLYK